MKLEEALISLDPQVLFDHVVEALAIQGEPALQDYGVGCAYINYSGYRCAIGHCLTPAALEALKHDTQAANLGVEAMLDRIAETPSDSFLLPLQGCHDTRGSRAEVALRFLELAENHGLESSAVKTFMSESWVTAGGTEPLIWRPLICIGSR